MKKMYIFLKRKIYYFLNRFIGAEFQSKPEINCFSVFNENSRIGRNFHSNGLRIYGNGSVTIGNNFHCGKKCEIYTQIHNYEGEKLPYDHTKILQEVNIGDNVWLGAGVTILGGVTIGEGAIIQAKSVVVKDIPPLGIAGGHPANVFKFRDKNHYRETKKASNEY